MSFKEWFDSNLAQYSNKITEQGAINLIEYDECIQLINNYESEIWQILINASSHYNYQNVMEMIIDFCEPQTINSLNDLKVLLVCITCEKLACEKLASMSFS